MPSGPPAPKAFSVVSVGFLLVLVLAFPVQADTLLDPLTQPKFVNPLPLPGVLQPTMPGGNHYEVSISQFQQSLGLVDPFTGDPLLTTVWGYNGSYPGPTIEARSYDPITVHWMNDLVDGFGTPLPHLLPVDTSVHWAMPPGWPASGVPVVTHVHGGHTESASDGLPEQWFTPGFALTGAEWVKEVFSYENDQEPATIWYHDHALGITRLNVYAGLAGFYLIRDEWEESLNLPSGVYEIPLAIQDRLFTGDGQLFYPYEPELPDEPADPPPPPAPTPSVLPEFFGDIILVNGKAWPYLNVEPRKYRLRILNGSDSRFYNIWLAPGKMVKLDPVEGGDPALNLNAGPALHQIGTDDGLLDHPVTLSQLLIAPGERADVVVDFSAFAGRTLVLKNNARAPYPKGEAVDPRTSGRIMAFRVGTTPVADPSELPYDLRFYPILPLGNESNTRKLILFESQDEFGRLKPMLGTVDDGVLEWDDPVTEDPTLNSTEVWEVYNGTVDAHPIHLHLVSFQILSRQKFKADQDAETGALSGIRLLGRPRPPADNEKGWKDTAQMYPGEVTRVIARFDRPGRYVWHCHILSHEDHEMMRPFMVTPPVAAQNPTSSGTGIVNAGPEIRFRLPEAGEIDVTIFDVLGRRVRQLERSFYPVGESVVPWDGTNAAGQPVPSGIYFYRATGKRIDETNRLIVLH